MAAITAFGPRLPAFRAIPHATLSRAALRRAQQANYSLSLGDATALLAGLLAEGKGPNSRGYRA